MSTPQECHTACHPHVSRNGFALILIYAAVRAVSVQPRVSAAFHRRTCGPEVLRVNNTHVNTGLQVKANKKALTKYIYLNSATWQSALINPTDSHFTFAQQL